MKARPPAIALGVSAALFCSASMLGCPGTLADKECFLQERDAHAILVASCTETTCHNAQDKALGLDLETAGIGSRLKGTPTLTCNSQALVVPGDPDGSILYSKLFDAPPCGSRMPLGQPALFDEDIEVIRVWIAGMDGSCSSPSGTGGTPSTGGAGGTGGAGTGGGGTGGAGTGGSMGGAGGNMGGTGGM